MSLSDIVIVVDGRVLSSTDLAIDGIGNIKFRVQVQPALNVETDVVIIVRELVEPSTKDGHGRRLGLPLFSVGLEGDNPGK
jgi:hypothetical protein